MRLYAGIDLHANSHYWLVIFKEAAKGGQGLRNAECEGSKGGGVGD